jgi:AcrR family transcriptional regulator
VQRDVVDTVLEMVGDGATLSSLSFVRIAERAGVSRNSIYRRWKTKERLLVDVAKSIGREMPDLNEHSARENVVKVLDHYFTRDMDPRVVRLEQAIAAEAIEFPDAFECYADVVDVPLGNALKTAIRGGKDTGEIRVDVDENVLVAVLVSADRGRDRTGSQRLVDLVFDGVCPA